MFGPCFKQSHQLGEHERDEEVHNQADHGESEEPVGRAAQLEEFERKLAHPDDVDNRAAFQ